MGWPACVVTCVGIVSFCAMICFIAKYGFDAVKSVDLGVQDKNPPDDASDKNIAE